MSAPAADRGFVSLVGAGPGDLDLLTRKAARRLAEADLVLYDALVDPGALDLAPTAQRVFVGKRAGRPQSTGVHPLADGARGATGRRVVRLKGGDPFVFGRGGEEALALAAAGIPFEVVPGVSSAIAAAALAGIPVTHRGLSTGFVVVSGHAEEAYRAVLESLAPHSATVVVMMGVGRDRRHRARIARPGVERVDAGRGVFGASTPESAVWTGTLRDLEARIRDSRQRATGHARRRGGREAARSDSRGSRGSRGSDDPRLIRVIRVHRDPRDPRIRVYRESA